MNSTIPFLKMHGLGNDFVVLDGRAASIALDAPLARAIADRRTGIGCDQLILMESPTTATADVAMRIFNADGGEVEACGNAARCIAALMMEERGTTHTVIASPVGLLEAAAAGAGTVCIDMGLARLEWRDIPLAEAVDPLHVPVEAGPLSTAVAVNMGNPHAVFFVADAEAVALAELGPRLEHHPLFPQRTNVEVVQVLAPDRLRMRVWERGVGITRACGTGACAAVVAAASRKLGERRAEVVLDGGTLGIEWLANGHVQLTGPARLSFRGTVDPARLGDG